MVFLVDNKTGTLTIRIPKCIMCKRPLKRDYFANENEGTTMVGPALVSKILYACPRGHVKFQVGNVDLAEIAKYPSDKIIFETDTNIDPKQFKTIDKR